MSEDNFGPWIDWAGGECPIPDAKAGDWQYMLHSTDFPADKPACSPLYKPHWEAGTIAAYRVRLPADDLLRQAIEALTNSCNLLEHYIETFGDMSGANRADLNDYRAVITAYDKRSA